MHMFIQSPCSTNTNLGSSKVIPIFNHKQDAVELAKYVKKTKSTDHQILQGYEECHEHKCNHCNVQHRSRLGYSMEE